MWKYVAGIGSGIVLLSVLVSRPLYSTQIGQERTYTASYSAQECQIDHADRTEFMLRHVRRSALR